MQYFPRLHIKMYKGILNSVMRTYLMVVQIVMFSVILHDHQRAPLRKS